LTYFFYAILGARVIDQSVMQTEKLSLLWRIYFERFDKASFGCCGFTEISTDFT
jgi:hypothetical protein